MNCRNFAVLLLAFSGMLLFGMEKIVVKTLPDGYNDNRIGSIFSDEMSILSFYTWAKEKKFTDSELRLSITLPENYTIIHYSVCRHGGDKKQITSEASSKGKRRWILSIGSVRFNSVFGTSGSYEVVPWTDSALFLFIHPTGKVPEAFSAKWEISGSQIESISGEMKLETMPAPKLARYPKHKSVWSTVGYIGYNHGWKGGWTRETYEAALKIMKNAGINGLEETGGCWMPEAILPLKELLRRGFQTEYAGNFSYSQAEPEVMAQAGFQLREEDFKVNLLGKRVKSRKDPHKYVKHIYCFTSMAEKDSPVRAYMRSTYRKLIEKGFGSFYTDYEPTPYLDCYCEKCRRAFAKFAHADETECLKMSPGELVYKYPYEWYAFRCETIARVLGMLNEELGVPIGWNSNLSMGNCYMPPFKSSGFVTWAEDPRIFDKYVAFHDADNIAGALGSINGTEIFMQKNEEGKQILQKPVIVRATSLLWVHTWTPFTTLGRQDAARREGFDGLGLDRRKLNKLTIANTFALGVAGIRVYTNPFEADAAAFTGLSEGLRFTAEFEDILRPELRLDRNSLSLYDCSTEESPYGKIAQRGSISSYYYNYGKTFGFVQAVIHQKENLRQISLFNWDFYQTKKVRLEFNDLPEKKCFVNIRLENQAFTLEKTLDGNSISIELPAASICAILLTPEKLYPVRKGSLPVYSGGKLIPPYQLGRIRDGMAPFYERVYNFNVGKIIQKIPDAGFKLIAVKNKDKYWHL